MKVLVTGGRDFRDTERMHVALEKHVPPDGVVIHGDARGADRLAGRWAADHNRLCRAYPADWKRHGRAAGPIRNQAMLDTEHPDLVVAFRGGRGTADMIRRAMRAKIRVELVA